MSFTLIPDAAFNRVTDIRAGFLTERGIAGVIVDVDNTLGSYRESEPSEPIISWVKTIMQSGIKVGILSNNREQRVKSFSAPLGVDYFYRARKPSRRGFVHLAQKMGLRAEHVAVVGDQIFTDILGAKRSGMIGIIVKPTMLRSNPLLLARYLFELPFRALIRQRNRAQDR